MIDSSKHSQCKGLFLNSCSATECCFESQGGSPDRVLLALREKEEPGAFQEGITSAVAESCGKIDSLLKFAVEEQVRVGASTVRVLEGGTGGERQLQPHQKPKKGKKHSSPGKASPLGGNLGRQLSLLGN